MPLWHRVICVPFERHAIRETVEGVLGFRCGCGLWRPVMTRTQAERDTFPKPAHERYKPWRQVLGIVRRKKAV